jgi:altronate dehydratase
MKQEEDIDLNCGEIADGSASVDEIGEQLFKLMLETASGTKSKSERTATAERVRALVLWARDVACSVG